MSASPINPDVLEAAHWLIAGTSHDGIDPVSALRKIAAAITRFAARFERAGLWYAPLVALRNAQDGAWVTHDGEVLAVTDPLALARQMSNWREAGIDLPPYETVSLLSDEAFDAFMRFIILAGFRLAVDPLFDPGSKAMVGGFTLVSMEDIERR